MKIMVYSHDTFGLGNIRRMLAICQYLLDSMSNLSILLVSGSPMLHRFRLPQGLDYIKLPCMGRDEVGQVSVKYLKTQTEEITKLRSDLILATTANFKPDLVLVDKKPAGIKGELSSSLKYLQKYSPQTKLILLLRDILDSPEKTVEEWNRLDNYQLIQEYYSKILVLGDPNIFDVVTEYQFPQSITQKVNFCGYIRRRSGDKSPTQVRQELQLKIPEKLVLVTAGGGQDGQRLMENHLNSLFLISSPIKFKSLILTGPEMSEQNQQKIKSISSQFFSQVIIKEFSDDINSYLNAADLVVSMGGYNTVCEILSLGKKAIIVPRIKPVKEQWIRAKRMAELGFFSMISPEQLTPKLLSDKVKEKLEESSFNQKFPTQLNLEALAEIKEIISGLMGQPQLKPFFSKVQVSQVSNLCRQLQAV